MLKHIEQFIKGSTRKGYKGPVTDIVHLSLANCHRTTFGKFLSEGVWNINLAWKGVRKFALGTIYGCAKSNVSMETIFKAMKVAYGVV